MKKAVACIVMCLLSGLASAQIPDYLPTDSLIAWYPFNGNAINEANPGTMNGTVTGPVLFVDRFGNPDRAYRFNGDTDHIDIDTAFFDISWSNYTISAWVNADILSNPFNSNMAQCIINTIPHNGMAMYFNWRTYSRYVMYAGSNPPSSGWDILSHKRSAQPCVISEWVHLAMVKQNDYSYSLYVNGEHDTTYSATTLASPNLSKMVLGRSDPSVISEGFFGTADDYAIWQRALSGCDVRRLFNSQKYLYITATPPDTTFASTGATTHISITDTGAGNTYKWQVKTPTATTYTNVPASPPYSGVATPTLTITAVPGSFGGNRYRCVVTGSECTDSSTATLLLGPSAVSSLHGISAITPGPNPVSDHIHFLGATTHIAYLFDMSGCLVLSCMAAEGMNVSDLPAGLYLLAIEDADSTPVWKGRITKQ